MKVAAAQTPVSGDIAENGACIRAIITEAAAAGVRLICFCEGALSGYAKAQILDPHDWRTFAWDLQERELRAIATLCGELGVCAVVGGAHRLDATARPHNSLYVFNTAGELLTRYDKRFLSHSEVSDWYTPGTAPIVFEVEGYRFGCAICIECQFGEVFSAYERLGADAVLFASYGIGEPFQVNLRAHAALNCLWIIGATPAQKAHKGPSGIIGPDGRIISHAPAATTPAFATAALDRSDPAFDVVLHKARPWRAAARQGGIYQDKIVDDPRSGNRQVY